ncbi:MAG TPA: hypothetical protein VGF55_33415 [Gemmataceae bacterium]|jgi:hypothetical protein
MLVFEPLEARWEASPSKEPVLLGRARIPGGWLVGRVAGVVISPDTVLCFVSDPDHRWDGSSLPKGGAAK